MNAYFLTHNGLGDNILVNGALNYLSLYYDKVYFLCKDINLHHINHLYYNTNIIPIPFDANNEFRDCHSIINERYESNDIYISGVHKSYLKTSISKAIEIHTNCKSCFIPSHFMFGIDFYKDINLNPCYMIEYFKINISDEIKQLYLDISKYKLVFFHTESSETTINVDAIIDKFIHYNDYLIICADKNVYPLNSDKYNVAKMYVKLPTIIHYAQILIESKELHMVDSSISCLALCLKLSNKLKYVNFQIYNRFTSQPIDLSV